MILASQRKKQMRHLESEQQIALFQWATMMERRFPELGMMFHIPNGGARHIRVAQRLKAEGVKPGVPDIFLPVARKKSHGFFIEMKSAAGVVGHEQNRWLKFLELQGFYTDVCYSWIEAAQKICRYLGIDPKESGV